VCTTNTLLYINLADVNDFALAELEAANHLLSFFPGIELTLESYLKQRNALQDAAWPTVPLLPGVKKLVLHLKAHNIPIAVATGSRRSKFELKTGHLGEVFDCFEGKVVCGDEQEHYKGMRGKPYPDIFVVAAREMLKRDVGDARLSGAELSPNQIEQRGKGLVFEDGLPGMQAGKRAGMSGKYLHPEQVILMRSFSYSGLGSRCKPIRRGVLRG